MEKRKPDSHIKALLEASGHFYKVSGIKAVDMCELPPFKDIYHRIIYRVYTKDGKTFELLKETVDKNGDFSVNSARYMLKGCKEI